MKKIPLLAALVLFASACTTTQTEMPPTPEPTADAQEATAAIAAAEAARAKAAAVGYEWRDTGMMIKAAQKAVEEQDYAKAMKLAGLAERQGENAVKQHAQQMEAVKQF